MDNPGATGYYPLKMLDNVPYTEVIQPLESLKAFHLLGVEARSQVRVNGSAIVGDKCASTQSVMQPALDD